jgi:hypothetical protein
MRKVRFFSRERRPTERMITGSESGEVVTGNDAEWAAAAAATHCRRRDTERRVDYSEQ